MSTSKRRRRRHARSMEFPRVSIYPVMLHDDESRQRWTRLVVEYEASPYFNTFLDLDEVNQIFLLKDAVDSYIKICNLKRPRK